MAIEPVTGTAAVVAGASTLTIAKDVLEGVDTMAKAIGVAKELGLLQKLTRVMKAKRRILVLGSSGAGKTQFIDSLRTILPDVIHRTNRTQQPQKRDFDLANKYVMKLIDTPGQAVHHSKRIHEIRSAVAKADGVINVVSYGYHEPDVPSKEALTDTGKADPDFLKACRQLEIDQLHEWTSQLSFGVRRPWLLTLVSKADLWWDKRPSVLKHYEAGPYYQALGAAQQMSPTVCPYSSVQKLFFGAAPVSGYFDDSVRAAIRASFFQTLAAVLDYEK